jgi:DNA-binding NarL/FixJ family response regulator
MKVLVLEDHVLVREGLVGTVKGLGGDVAVIGVADANAAIAVLEGEDVDLMLLDLMLPGTKGQTLLPLLRRRFPTVPVVVVSAMDDADTVAEVMGMGASGFVSKSGSGRELIDALRTVLAGEIYLTPALRDATVRSALAKKREQPLAQRFGLTAAQARVLEQLVDGGSNREIGERLGIGEGTVKIHVSAIIKALNVTNRAEAALAVNREVRR